MCKSKCGKGCCTASLIAKVLVVVGGLNWGLVGLGMLLGNADGWNVVNMLLGGVPSVEAVVYVLVGLSALVMAFGCRCSKCSGGACEGGSSEMKEEAPMAEAQTTESNM